MGLKGAAGPTQFSHSPEGLLPAGEMAQTTHSPPPRPRRLLTVHMVSAVRADTDLVKLLPPGYFKLVTESRAGKTCRS